MGQPQYLSTDPNEGEFDTYLSPAQERQFQAWKQRYAPRDSGADYDLRGAFKAGLKPDPKNGHWPDTFKKPNHPTFSDESIYAKGRPAGHWSGDTYTPAQQYLSTDPSEGDAPASVPALADRESTLTAGKPESAWHSAWESVRNSFFGTPEHQELYEEQQRTGVPMGIDPPPSKVYGTIAEGASMLGLGPASLAGAGGVVGRAGRFIASHPTISGAIEGAAPYAMRWDLPGALEHAGYGAFMGGVLGHLPAVRRAARSKQAPIGEAVADELRAGLTYKLGKGIPDVETKAAERALADMDVEELTREAKALFSAGKVEESRPLFEEIRARGPASAPKPITPRAQPVAAKPAAPAESLAPTPSAPKASPPDAGRQAAERHARRIAVAKQAAQQNPKIGQKIWIELDDAGDPVRVVTSDEAGAIVRTKGEKYRTFIKNLWGRPAQMLD